MNESHAREVAEIERVVGELMAPREPKGVKGPARSDMPWIRSYCGAGTNPVTSLVQAAREMGRYVKGPFPGAPTETEWRVWSVDRRVEFVRNYMGLK